MNEQKVREAIEYLKASIEADEEVQKGIKDEEIIKISRTFISYEKTAIEALEKQLPKRVDAREEYRNFHGRLLYYKGFCPDCGFIVHSNKNKCCSCCTQVLDWSE